MRDTIFRRALTSMLSVTVLLLVSLAAQATPFTFQGYLEENGNPVTGNRNLELRLFDNEFGGIQLGVTGTFSNTFVADGLINLDVDFLFDLGLPSNYWVEVSVDGVPLPRIEVLPAPWATSTLQLVGRQVDTSSPMVGDVLKWDGSAWTHSLDNGQVYSPGTGIGISGGQISIAVPYRLPQGCVMDEVAKWSGSDWICGTGSGLTYTAGSGLQLVGTEFSANFASNGSATTVARGDHDHYGADFSGSSEMFGLGVTNNNTNGMSAALIGRQTGAVGGIGVRGEGHLAGSTGVFGSGDKVGVEGLTTQFTGTGVLGQNIAATGAPVGVKGTSTIANNGIGVEGTGANTGVHGVSNGMSGAPSGVYGESIQSADGIGVLGHGHYRGAYGVATSTASGGVGVEGRSVLATDGVGVFGIGTGIGVSGYTGAVDAAGVFGYYTFATGSGSGVVGLAESATATGVSGTNSSTSAGAVGVRGTATASGDGTGVVGSGATGVHGISNPTGVTIGVIGESPSSGGTGVMGRSTGNGINAVGVRAVALGADATALLAANTSTSGDAIGLNARTSAPAGIALQAETVSTLDAGGATAIRGINSTGSGVGVLGENTSTFNNAVGVRGTTVAPAGSGVEGISTATSGTSIGVLGRVDSGNGYAIYARNQAVTGLGTAIRAESGSIAATAVDVAATGAGATWAINAAAPGDASNSYAVRGITVSATGTGAAIYGESTSPSGDAGRFIGDVSVTGSVSKGGGSFKIDHPLDPEGQFLYHSFVESPDMMNIYNGNVETDADGVAVVTLPDWFEALNMEFRYQLTVIGSWARAMVAEEIVGNQFVVRTDEPFAKVSWQVTGVRHDAWAEAHRIPVEQEKAPHEQGKYLHPEAWGVAAEKALMGRGGKSAGQE